MKETQQVQDKHSQASSLVYILRAECPFQGWPVYNDSVLFALLLFR